jgi:hypothetical protein
VQERCPNCGQYHVERAHVRPRGALRVGAIIWLVLWLVAAAVLGYGALVAGYRGGWLWGVWVGAAAGMCAVVAVIPRMMVRETEERRARDSRHRRCRACGFSWTV